MTETTYRASCQCGKFVYEATLPDPLSAAVCNCSICTRKGYVFAFESKDKPIRIVKGSLDDLTAYHRKGDFIHWFCPDCAAPVLCRNIDGIQPFGLNIRCFQGNINVWDLEAKTTTMRIPGITFGTPYTETLFTGTEPTGGPAPGEPAKTYYGSCQCGAVRLALRCKPLDALDPNDPKDVVRECNCSICQRLACRWFYPSKEQVSIEDPDHQLAYYSFGRHVCRKSFCRQCGVTLTNGTIHPSEDELAALPPLTRAEETVEKRARIAGRMPVNLRVLYGVDLDKLPTVYSDGSDMLPPYANP